MIKMKMKMGQETSLSSLDMITTSNKALSLILNDNLFFLFSTSRWLSANNTHFILQIMTFSFIYEKEVLHSSGHKFLMLLFSNLTALKNRLLKAQLKTMYLLSLRRLLGIFNLNVITHSNNNNELVFFSYICFFNKEKPSDWQIDNLSFTYQWLWKCVI